MTSQCTLSTQPLIIPTSVTPTIVVEPICAGKTPQQTRVVVAMSGGVDSSVVAALLHSLGYEVIGITLQLYDHGEALQKKGACCAGQDIRDAKRVCEALHIRHYVLDYESLFKQSVIEEFADSYLRGETPIPCVRCNQTVKFRDLFQVAKDLNADAMATGHYIKRTVGPHGPQLHRAYDDGKDQSYFLFSTTREQLEFLRFPLGGIPKAQTRQLAEHFGLQVAVKPDSQDICFVPGGSYAKVIERLRPGAFTPGDVVDMQGNILGQHQGIALFTIGQRRGLGIASSSPLYVVKIDPTTNQVILGPESALGSLSLTIKELNWLGHEPIPESGLAVNVKIRSAAKPIPATIHPLPDNHAKVVFNTPERGTSPGQACVVYHESVLLGGGWIVG
ncbi:MAG: tRNA 2-thiouridine(34) synthase MnmA [Alphaproteobacteria bacterium]|nr:tRNA 2-thiouridine(34) synthase MnmA [Alphaproteobacteria bacterium]